MGIVRTQISATSINAHFAGIDHILVPFMIAGMNPLGSVKLNGRFPGFREKLFKRLAKFSFL